MKQKINTKLGVIIIVIIAITAGMFVWKCYRENKFTNRESQMSSETKKSSNLNNGTFEISNKWTIVNHGNFWNNPNLFAHRSYSFPNIEFSYPENWDFRCCNDMEFVSTHTIYSNKEQYKSLPSIRISNISSVGCPSLKEKCALNEIIKITANEKFNRLISAVSNDQILPKTKLKNLNTIAFVYKKTEKDNKFSKAYIINLGGSIIEVDFINYELLDNKFIEKFLNGIVFENK
jgi:hypothetical protein